MKPLLMILPALLLASCSLFGGDNDASELEEQRRRWERLGIDTYTYDLTLGCFCLPVGAVRIQVRADTVYAAIVLETGAPAGELARVLTVEALFDTIEDAMARKAHRLDVTYDETLAYPTLIDIDYQVNVADEEVRYVAENLTPLRVR